MTQDIRETRIERMLELMDRVARQMRPDLSEQWPEVELTMPQMKTLILLSNGPLRMSDIADQIGSSYSATTAMIDRLVEKGLVNREHSTADRRVVTCRLNERGVETLDAFWQIQNDRMREIVSVLSPSEADKVIEALEILSGSHERAQNPTIQTG